MNSTPQRIVGHVTAAAGGEKSKAFLAGASRQIGALSLQPFKPLRKTQMNKSELIAKVAALSGETRKSVEAVLTSLADVVTSTLKEGEEVTLPGLGNLSVTDRAARAGRNPKTGEPIQIAARKAPHFSAAKALKDAVNG